jgi:hypothetical protein
MSFMTRTIFVAALIAILPCAWAWNVGDTVPLFVAFREGDINPPTTLSAIAPQHAPVFGVDRVVFIPSVNFMRKELKDNTSHPLAHIKMRVDLGVVRRRTPWITLKAPIDVTRRNPDARPFLSELILRFHIRGAAATFAEISEISYSARYTENPPPKLALRYEWISQHTVLPQAGVAVTVILSLAFLAVTALFITADVARSPLAKVLVVKDRDD